MFCVRVSDIFCPKGTARAVLFWQSGSWVERWCVSAATRGWLRSATRVGRMAGRPKAVLHNSAARTAASGWSPLHVYTISMCRWGTAPTHRRLMYVLSGFISN